MRRAAFAILAGLLLCGQVVLPGFPPGVFSNAAADMWSYPANTFDIAFTRGQAAEGFKPVTVATLVSITRTTVGNARNSSGVWQAFTSGQLRQTDIGVLVENAATNLALQSRDMTQSGTWVATNMTTALNAVGIDGVNNAASTITATAGNALLIQSLTLTSASRTVSVFVKCVTCTGNIQYSNSAILSETFTTLDATKCVNPITGVGTAPNTSNFVRCAIQAITALNPVIGFKIVNSGDSVIVDANQLETASSPTSPIYTTAGTVTRNADDVQLNATALALMNVGPNPGSYWIEWSQDYTGVNQTGNPYTFRQRVDSTNGIEALVLTNATPTHRFQYTVGGVQQYNLVTTSGVVAGTSYRGAMAQATNDAAACWTASLQASCLTDATVTLDTNTFTFGVGESPGGGEALNGYMRRLVYFNSRMSNAAMQAWAQSTPGTFP